MAPRITAIADRPADRGCPKLRTSGYQPERRGRCHSERPAITLAAAVAAPAMHVAPLSTLGAQTIPSFSP